MRYNRAGVGSQVPLLWCELYCFRCVINSNLSVMLDHSSLMELSCFAGLGRLEGLCILRREAYVDSRV